jgi:hypothetical protein
VQQRTATTPGHHDRGPRHRAGRAALITAGAATLLAVATATYFLWVRHAGEPSARPTPSATASRSPRVAVVTYDVTGTGRVDINYADPGKTSSVILENQVLPWRVVLPRQPVRFVSITSSREPNDPKPHHARILIDGVELCGGTNHPGYTDAGCMELVPPS